jgi:hypothetical protein
MLAFAAERAIQQLAAVVIASSIFAHQNLYPAPYLMARCYVTYGLWCPPESFQA